MRIERERGVVRCVCFEREGREELGDQKRGVVRRVCFEREWREELGLIQPVRKRNGENGLYFPKNVKPFQSN
jgi:hypothetical protein